MAWPPGQGPPGTRRMPHGVALQFAAKLTAWPHGNHGPTLMYHPLLLVPVSRCRQPLEPLPALGDWQCHGLSACFSSSSVAVPVGLFLLLLGCGTGLIPACVEAHSHSRPCQPLAHPRTWVSNVVCNCAWRHYPPTGIHLAGLRSSHAWGQYK